MNILQKFILALCGLSLATLPVAVSAQTVVQLQTQLQGLLAQIASLQSGASVSGSAGVGTGVSSSAGLNPSAMMTSPGFCRTFDRSLRYGSRGDDVTSLQQFLIQQGFLSASATGYFGALTQAAVGKWQGSAGIATSGSAGFGMFGPMSRSNLNHWCSGNGGGNGGSSGSGGGSYSQNFSADQTSGAAPLAVNFSTSDSIASNATYSVDFGDGQNAAMTKGSCIGITAIVGGQGGIRCSFNASHTYTQNGVYTAKLLSSGMMNCPPNAMCATPIGLGQTVGTVTITVGNNATQSFSVSPMAGSAPLNVAFTETGLTGGTYNVNFGDGTSGTLNVPTIQCITAPCIPGPQTVSHTYAQSGTFTATLMNNPCNCPANGVCNCPNMQILGTATVTVSGSSSGSGSDQRINAPGSVTLQQGGIVEVRNINVYFTLSSIAASGATIQPTAVGCWNSFPSDPTPQIRCMIAVMPVAPLTLTVGQTYVAPNYSITLSSLTPANATFSISAGASSSY